MVRARARASQHSGGILTGGRVRARARALELYWC